MNRKIEWVELDDHNPGMRTQGNLEVSVVL